MIHLLAALVLTGGELASNVALAGHIEAIEHQPIVIESTIEIPAGHAIIDQEWELEKPAKGTVDTSGNLFNVWGPPREEPYELLHKVQIAKTHKLQDGSLAAVLPFRKVRKAYQITIKAARPRPPPVTPVDPVKPDKPDPTAGPVVHVIILRDQSTQKQETTQQLISLRLKWKDNFPRPPPSEPQVWEHDDPQPKVRAWANKFPAGAAHPYCFLVDDDGDIIEQFEFTTASDVIRRCRTTN